MEINYGDYRINKPEGMNEVWLYRGSSKLAHFLLCSERTEDELIFDMKETIRVLDL